MQETQQDKSPSVPKPTPVPNVLATIPQNQVDSSPRRNAKQGAIQQIKPPQTNSVTIKQELLQQRKQTNPPPQLLTGQSKQSYQTTQVLTGQAARAQNQQSPPVSNGQGTKPQNQLYPMAPDSNQQSILKQPSTRQNRKFPPLSVTIKQELINRTNPDSLAAAEPEQQIMQEQPLTSPTIMQEQPLTSPTIPTQQEKIPQEENDSPDIVMLDYTPARSLQAGYTTNSKAADAGNSISNQGNSD